MSEAIDAKELATRVHELVDRFDGGDVVTAARRIGARESDLRAILAAESGYPSLAALSAIVRGYDVDTWWLICGESEEGRELPAERRVGTLNLLSELGTTLTLQRRLQGAPPRASDGLANA
ncbi:MAG TPA: hypothetical protein VJN70_05565 [Gemmatimonadaceae bacterium]|nr:hypothetical protein [Gemmatimonadaceae bacterium]